MTQEERYRTSIKILSTLRDDVAKHPDVGESVFNADRYFALTDALEALESRSEAEEYRTPMKVKRYKTHCNGKDFTYKITCPSCNESLCGKCSDKKTPYCMNCGQALDWSEAE